MPRSIWIAVALTLSACSFGQNVGKAAVAISQFHADLNESKFDKIVSESGPEIKGEPQFAQLLSTVRRKLGKVATTEQIGWNENVNLKGTFVTVVNKTKFEKGEGSENFVFRVDGAKLTLVGWHINSQALILN